MKPSITPVTEGQKNELGNVVADAARKGVRTIVDGLVARGVLTTSEQFQKVLARGNEIVATALEAVQVEIAEIAESVKGHLKLISGAETLTIPATTGKRTFANSATLFTGSLDPDFTNYGIDNESEPSAEVRVEVHELVKNGTYADIYKGMEVPLEQLALTQDQAITFVEKNRKWIRSDRWTRFLLKEKVKDANTGKVEVKFFVADVDVDARGRLNAYGDPFSHDYVWNAAHRNQFVLPQLTPKT